MDLLGKKIILTGSTGGVGQEILELLYTHGAVIVANGRNKKKINALKEKYKNNPNVKKKGRIFFIPCDLNNLDDLQIFIFKCLKILGNNVDVLINNAGVGYHCKIENIIIQELREVFNVNVFAPIILTSKLLPHFNKGGKIINITSILGSKATNNTSVYTASKHALNGFSKVLRIETASRELSIIQIEPGSIDTNFNLNTHDQVMKNFLKARKLNKIKPKVIAETVLHAISLNQSVCYEVIRIMPTEQII